MPDLKFFLIDDELGVRALIKSYIKKNYTAEIYEAINGLEGLKLLDKVVPDVIFLDVSMPYMTGLEFLEIIKKDEKYKDIPVIMMTAERDKQTVSDIIRLGVSDYILKPVNLETNSGRIKKIISKASIKMAIASGQAKILVADSDDKFIAFFKELFSKEHEIITTSSGTEALTLFLSQKPAIVILGTGLATIDEQMVIKKIHQLNEKINPDIYLLKAAEEEQSFDENLIKGIIKKSFDEKEFKENFLQAVLNKQDTASS